MLKITFLTYHYYNSRRKAGFHHLARAYSKLGHSVSFITLPFSLLSILRNDIKSKEKFFLKNLIKNMEFERVRSIVNFSFSHPVDRGSEYVAKFLNFCFYLNKKCKNEIKEADVIIFESTIGIIFFNEIKSLNQRAKLIYRMSDDMDEMQIPKFVIEYQNKILPLFDLVSVPSYYMYTKYSKISPNNISIDYHGIDKDKFDKPLINPYSPNTINHIFVGMSHLDENFINIASAIFPNHFFHIIGPFKNKCKRDNVIYYGVLPFEDTIPYINYATTGLSTLLSVNPSLISTFTDSLKIIQYTYCKLPIIVPRIMYHPSRNNFFYYEYNDNNSIEKAIKDALEYDTNKINNFHIYTWEELALKLLETI